jgi:hypothetical protein
VSLEPLPSAPLPSVPLPSVPLPSVPLPSVPLGDTDWLVWGDALIRSTGFPADGLDRFAAPDCAAAADAHLDGADGSGDSDSDDSEAFADAFAKAAAAMSREAYAVAGDPRFREAVTWQSTGSRHAVDGIRAGGPHERRRHKRREREIAVLRYWQRYCAKNETVSFFGPACWGTVEADAPLIEVRPGERLLRTRTVHLEHWAVTALAERIAADDQVKPWLPVAVHPHLWLDGRVVHRPTGDPVTVSAAEAAVLAHCDGRAAREVAADAAAEAAGPRRAADDYPMLGSLAERGLVRWGVDLPPRLGAEQVLAGWVDTIDDPAVRAGAADRIGTLAAARDRVADAAGDPDRLACALDDLGATFTALTGEAPHRRSGQTYAARTPCLEETTRDLDFRIGPGLLDAIAAPLGLLLDAVRWLSAAVADAYRAALRQLFAELDDGSGSESGTVGMGELWYLVNGLLFGSGERPTDAVAAEFTRRCAELFGLTDTDTDTDVRAARRDLTAADLASVAARLFPASPPGWSTARLHSPDLQICAESVEALRRGEFFVVLGELHVAWATFDSGTFVTGHPDPERLRAAMTRDLGAGRVHVLFPLDWPRFTPRLNRCLDDPDDVLLGYVPAPGADRRLVPVSSLTARDDGTEIVATAPDGRSWTALDLLAEVVTIHAVDAFKLIANRPHTPRVTIDRLVVSRETWRTTVGESGLAAQGMTEQEGYLAARRWRRALGLPEQVFVKLGTETKPFYVDLTSPTHVGSLRHMCRSARTAGGDDTSVVVTEMLPTPDQAWLPDAEGRRYFSELRLQICDGRPSGR